MKRVISACVCLLALSWGALADAAYLAYSPNGLIARKDTLTKALTDVDTIGADIVNTTPGAVISTQIVLSGGRTFRCENGGWVAFTGSGGLRGLPYSEWKWFGKNTTPGTTDMTTAAQNSIKAAFSGYSSAGTPNNTISVVGKSHATKDAYKITNSLTLGPVTSTTWQNGKSIEIYGDGQGTQVVNAAPAGKPTFDMSGASFWTISDMLLTGNSANPNDGIWVKNAALRTNIKRVVFKMAGHGAVYSNTNTALLEGCKFWPSPDEYVLTVPQAVSGADVLHHVYLTGDYVHDLTISNIDAPVDLDRPNAQGIYGDASAMHALKIYGGMMQGQSGGPVGIDLHNAVGWLVSGIYNESSRFQCTTCSYGVFTGAGNGSVGGSIELLGNNLRNTFVGVRAATLSLISSDVGNLFIGSDFMTSITDGGTDTKFIGVSVAGGAIPDSTNSNRVSNGGFTSVTTGWVPIDCTLASISGGVIGNALEMTQGSQAYQSAHQAVATTIGAVYTVTGYVKSGTSGAHQFTIGAGTSVNGFENGRATSTSSAAWTPYSVTFTATAASTYIAVSKDSNEAGTMLFDEIVVR